MNRSKKLPRHPLVQDALRELKTGKLPPLVDNPQAGAAERCGIGVADAARRRRPRADLSCNLRFICNRICAMALLSLGDLYETVKKRSLRSRLMSV